MTKSKYQDQFLCYPYTLSKEIHVPGWYPFPALKCNQAGFVMISGSKVIDSELNLVLIKTYSKPYLQYYATSIALVLFELTKLTKQFQC